MTARWWAPSGPHIGPDDTDLALLEPGGEVRYDLGAALFALHRTGAAACEAVATSPIPDEVRLVESLATARAGLANPLVDSVSKSVDGVSYAGLLVRDVFDEAELGALDLFRAAVAKGVPPPMAASRAGMVYGVPSAGMGVYRQLACDPRAHAVALQDAADRVLFAAVEKICADEVDEREEVSKAPVTTPDDPDTPYWDARSGGQFAPRRPGLREREQTPLAFDLDAMMRQAEERYGVGGKAPEKVEEEVAAPARPGVRRQRKQRQQRQQRKAPQRQTAGQRTVDRTIDRTISRTQNRQLERIPVRMLNRLKQAASVPPKTVEGLDFLRPLPRDTGPWDDDMDLDVTFVLTPEEFGRFKPGTKRDNRGRFYFRAGYLDPIKGGITNSDGEFRRSKQHTEVVEAAAKAVQKASGKDLPTVKILLDKDFPSQEDMEYRKIQDALDMIQDRIYRPDFDTEKEYDDAVDKEWDKVAFLRNPENTGWVVLYNSDDAEDFTINEFHLAGLRRRVGGGVERNRVLEFDPNQVFVGEFDDPVREFDPVLKVWRNQYFLTPYVTDEGDEPPMSKADTPDDPTTPYWDARVQGRFAPRRGRLVATDDASITAHLREQLARIGTEPVSQTEATPEVKRPAVRAQRKQREQRRQITRATPTRELKREIKREIKRVPTRELNRRQRRVIERAFPRDKPLTPPTELEALPEGGIYVVMSNEEFVNLLDSAGYQPKYEGATRVLPAKYDVDTISIRDELFTRADEDMLTASDAIAQAHELTKGYLVNQLYGTRTAPLHEEPIMLNPDDPRAPERLRTLVERMAAQHPKVSEITITAGESEDMFWLLGNTEPTPPVIVLDYHPKWDPEKETELRLVNSYRHTEFKPDPVWNDKTAKLEQTKIEHYRLVAPTIERWEVRNPAPVRPIGHPRHR